MLWLVSARQTCSSAMPASKPPDPWLNTRGSFTTTKLLRMTPRKCPAVVTPGQGASG